MNVSQKTTGVRSTLVKVKSPLRNVPDTWVDVPDNELFADIPLDYGPEVPDALADGTIPVSFLVNDLRVTALKWDQTQRGDVARLYVDGIQVGPPVDIETAPNPIELAIPQLDLEALADGPHEVHFVLGSRFGNRYVSLDKTIIIDTTPPGGNELPAIRFKLEYEQNGVTRQDIETDPADAGFLRGTVAVYKDQEAGQTLSFFLQVMPSGPVVPGTVGQVTSPILGNANRWSLAELVAAEAAGDVEFWYVVTDPAGNENTAPRSTLRMLVYDAPDALIPPRIPLFEDDNLIDEVDARTPIAVEIPQFAHGRVGDVIVLHLGRLLPITINPPLQSGDLPADPDAPDPSISIRTVEVPYETLSLLQDDGNGNIDPIFSFEASYDVLRSIFSLPSDPLDVDVDLTLAGGIDPDPTTPVHENLRPPAVNHAGADAVPNIIPVDYEEPVIATIPHLTVDGTPPDEVFINGDTVQLFRLGGIDGTTEIAVGAAVPGTPGADVEITIDPTDLVPGTWPFFYRVLRTLGTGQTNPSNSPRQTVAIADVTEQPGGNDFLPNVVFRETTLIEGYPALNYERANNGTILRIYEYINMTEDDEIVLHWQGNDDIVGEGNDIANAFLELKHTVVEADFHEKDDRLDDDDPYPPAPVPRVFIDFEVSYDEIRKITPPPPDTTAAFGSAWVTYTVTSAKGLSNASRSDRSLPIDEFPPLVIDAREP